MARAAHAAQIDLGFGDPACKNLMSALVFGPAI
jgi:hypothetical protein